MDTPVVPNCLGLNDLVYEPAEDSFLLLDALEKDLPITVGAKASETEDVLLALEVGCGSGLISTAIAKSKALLRGREPCVFAVDVNPNACLLTEKTGNANKVVPSALHPLLLDGRFCKPNPFKFKFDLIVCNPPYVPISLGENDEDKQSGLLQQSWDGGFDGNQFISPFLSNVNQLLNTDGVLYILLSSWNKPEELICNIAKPNGLNGVEIIKRAAGRERLSVWRFKPSV